jgi:tRNA-specific 2-thiouridylase
MHDRAGEMTDSSGAVLGRHRGQHHFTVGQRRGLGLATGAPLYVLDKDAQSNRVTVGPAAALRTDRVRLRAVRLHRPAEDVDRVKLRYRSKPLPARLIEGPDAGADRRAELRLGELADAAVPGQVACLMAGDHVVGWGTIGR